MSQSEREHELQARLSADRGDPAFAELADLLMADGRHQEALSVLLAGLSSNPSHLVGRLVLARLYIHLGFAPFAVRELKELYLTAPRSAALAKLIETIAPGTVAALDRGSALATSDANAQAAESGRAEGASAEAEGVVAEGEFEIDILESLEDAKK